MTRPTIANVAETAGVSKATVSRVLSGNAEYMRPETRTRVLEAIDKLDYRPSSIARSLTSKRTFTAGLLVSDIGNPFYPEVINGVEETALEQGYNIFLCNTSYDLERGMTYVRSLIDKQVDGVLIMSSTMSDEWVWSWPNTTFPPSFSIGKSTTTSRVRWALSRYFEAGIQAAVEHLAPGSHAAGPCGRSHGLAHVAPAPRCL